MERQSVFHSLRPKNEWSEEDGLFLMCVKWNLVFAFIIPILLLYFWRTQSLYSALAQNQNERENFMVWQWQQGGINFNKNNLLQLSFFFRRLLCWFVQMVSVSISTGSAYHSSYSVVQVVPSFLCVSEEIGVLVGRTLNKKEENRTNNHFIHKNGDLFSLWCSVLSDSVDVIQICFVFISSPVAR